MLSNKWQMSDAMQSNMLREVITRYFPHIPVHDQEANDRFMLFAKEVFGMGHVAGYQQTVSRIADDLKAVVDTYNRPQ